MCQCVRACASVCVRACVCVFVCVRLCVRMCVSTRVRVHVSVNFILFYPMQSLSSLSSSQPLHYMHSSGFHSLPSRSPTLQQQVSHPSNDLFLSMPASHIHPGATTAAAVAAKPTIRHSGSVPTLQYSTADYLPSKGQFKTSTHLHDFQKQLNESALKSSRDALATDLEKSKYQIKEFEGRVSNCVSVLLCICDQTCKRGLIHKSDFVTLKRHNFMYKRVISLKFSVL